MSEFYIYNNSERVGLLQHINSIQWLENYQSPGEVHVDARITDENISMLVEGNRIYNADSDTVGIIRRVEIYDEVEKDKIIARAVLSSRMLGDRVVMATLNITNAEKGMYQAYSENRRDLPIGIHSEEGFAARVDTQISWNSVLDAEESLAQLSGLGFKVVFNPVTAEEKFIVYAGTDRTESNDEYIGYFSKEIGNIAEVELVADNSEYKNVAIVAGEDSGSSRVVVVVSLGNFTGEMRREMFVDARDLQKEYQVAKDTGEKDNNGNPVFSYDTKTYTDIEYKAILEARGLEKLNEHLKDFSLICAVEQTVIKYGVDYSLGDVMPLILPSYNMKASARVSSVKRIYEQTGKKIEVALSEINLNE